MSPDAVQHHRVRLGDGSNQLRQRRRRDGGCGEHGVHSLVPEEQGKGLRQRFGYAADRCTTLLKRLALHSQAILGLLTCCGAVTVKGQCLADDLQ